MSPRWPCALPVCLLLAATAQGQTSGGFDAQMFRPLGAPQDVVRVSQSRTLSHLSLSGGLVVDFMLDPVALALGVAQRKAFSLVGSRLTLHGVAAVGLFDWVELGVAVPFVAFQGGDNREVIGTEGPVAASALGDVRFTTKVAVPKLRRPSDGDGFGAALTFGLTAPTGDVDAYAGDGAPTFAPGMTVDYRFENAVLIALNLGYLARTTHELEGTLIGSMATFGLGAEVPVVRRYGITVVGELAGGVGIESPLNSPRQVAAEYLFGLRWYSGSGVTVTVGGGGGCGCAIGNPSLRLFTSILWVPGKTREYEALERFKLPPVDPDEDDVIGDKDKCPQEKGPVENSGCPDGDKDSDGVVDRLDECPEDAPGPRGQRGCPLARVKGDRIVILEQVHFATDQDVILPESFPTLEEVARLIRTTQAIERVSIEGHTDIRASDAYNLDLSRRRAGSVERFLLGQAIDARRLRSSGYGYRRPVAPNDSDAGMSLNRRVEFVIEKISTAGEGEVQLKTAPGGRAAPPKAAPPDRPRPKRSSRPQVQ